MHVTVLMAVGGCNNEALIRVQAVQRAGRVYRNVGSPMGGRKSKKLFLQHPESVIGEQRLGECSA